jgi:hypothetical protein
MTKTFERFLRSFSDEDLRAFTLERGKQRPPYWRTMQVALRIERDRRGMQPDGEWAPAAPGSKGAKSAHDVSA